MDGWIYRFIRMDGWMIVSIMDGWMIFYRLDETFIGLGGFIGVHKCTDSRFSDAQMRRRIACGAPSAGAAYSAAPEP